MRIVIELERRHLAEVCRMTRSRGAWRRRSASILILSLLVLVLGGEAWQAHRSATPIDWDNIRGTAAVIILATTFIVIFMKWRATKAFRDFRDRYPKTIILNEHGLEAESRDGTRKLDPWASFSGWQKGNKVILVRCRSGSGFGILPIEGLADQNEVELESLLSEHLPRLA